MTTTAPKPIPAPLYVGATTCDFAPAFRDTDPELLALVKSCYESHWDEQTPLLVLADLLQERNDPREMWVRSGVKMWTGASALKPGKRDWDYTKCKAALAPVCETGSGWRVAGMWGVLTAWHAPTGDGSNRKMGETWADARVQTVQRCLWFWSLGFLETNHLDEADAAYRQADAAYSQAYAAGSQAYAAYSQAYAAGSQAYAAYSQAYAAGRQADAAGRQADAAYSQAYAAGRQADAAYRQVYVWRFSRSLWEKICKPQLKVLMPRAEVK